MEVQVGAAKVAKYAAGESGDTLEIIERPHGGLSMVLVDGQRSGPSAKIISNIVTRKAISLLGEGVRDGAVARAAHDYLRTHRRGQVSAELQLLSVDLSTFTVVISRNTHCPTFIYRDSHLEILEGDSQAIGLQPQTKPSIIELPIQPDTCVVILTDGFLAAGARNNKKLDLPTVVQAAIRAYRFPQQIADSLLDTALEADDGRASDDTSVVVLSILKTVTPNGARRLMVRFPVRGV